MEAFKQCVILNINAGSAEALDQQICERIGSHALFIAEKPGDAEQTARRAVEDGFDRVIAGGGDGTLNEVLNGLAGAFGRVQLGLLPLGTANDFARTIGVPAEVNQALDVIVAGRTMWVDVVRLTTCTRPEPHHFLNVSAGGFGALVDEKLDQPTKEFLGALGYVWSAVKALPELEEYHVSLAFDSEPPVTLAAFNVVIANARHAGGGIPVAPQATIDDGLCDVLVFRAVSLAKLATLVPKALLGQHLDDEGVYFRQARRVEISSQPPLQLNADGEIVGDCPATFEVLPRAIEMIVGEARLA